MFCPHCGFLNTGGSDLCAECGRELDSKGPSFNAPEPRKRQAKINHSQLSRKETPGKEAEAPGKPKLEKKQK